MQEHDPELSHAYKAAAHPEPPPALDARILAAARQAVTPQPRRRPAWFGWAVPLSSMAVLVLGISMLFRMQQEAPETLREEQSPLPARPLALTEVTPPAGSAPTTPPATPPTSPPAAKLSKPATQPAAPAPQSVPAAPPRHAFPDREAAVADAVMEKAADDCQRGSPAGAGHAAAIPCAGGGAGKPCRSPVCHSGIQRRHEPDEVSRAGGCESSNAGGNARTRGRGHPPALAAGQHRRGAYPSGSAAQTPS
jgi:hypothetical protein